MKIGVVGYGTGRQHFHTPFIAAAKARGVVPSVFQNRHYDADLQTPKKLLDEDRLGRVWRLHNRMDFDDPATLETGPTGGLLRDLGSHLVDQMIYLNGPVASVFGHIDHVELPEGRTDASFAIVLNHENGRMCEVPASGLNHDSLRELRAHGAKGAYISHSTDVQAQEIFAGRHPADDLAAWGYEPEARWGTLFTAAGAESVPSEQGRYHDDYEAFEKPCAPAPRRRSPPSKAPTLSRSSTPRGSAPKRAAPSRSDYGPPPVFFLAQILRGARGGGDRPEIGPVDRFRR